MQQAFIDKIVPAAEKVMHKYRILASLTIAQAILESSWGKSELAVKAYNLFGIKGKGPAGSYEVQSKEFRNGTAVNEVSSFRKYNNWDECLEDRSVFLLKERYKKVIGEMDYKKACLEIWKAGYATDPKYPEKLINIIEQFNLNKFDLEKKEEQMIKIFIDPGHGGKDPGAAANGLMEKELVLMISKHMKTLLNEYEGVQIRLSREDDRFIELADRARMANEWGANYYCSVHINAGGGDGFETYISQNASTQSVKNQNVIHAEILNAIGGTDRGKKRANYVVITASKMPAILTENLFIDHPDSAKKLKDPEFLKKVAHGHVNGLVQIFDLKRKESGNVNKDQTVSNWAKEAQQWVIKQGISDGARPKDQVTREELWTMLWRAAGNPKV